MGSALMPTEGLFFSTSFHTRYEIVKGIRRNETAAIETVRKKLLRHGCPGGGGGGGTRDFK